jgi:hypothetical protein
VPFCPACGRETASGNFCPYCGKPTGFSAGPPVTEGQPTVQQRYTPQQFYPPPPATYTPYSGSGPYPVSRETRVVPAHRLFVCAGVGAVSMSAAAAASFLPWVNYTGINFNGLHRDGRLVLMLGVLGIASAMLATVLKSRWPFPVLMVLGIAVVSVLLTDILNITRTVGLSMSNVGIGLYVGVASGAVAVVAGAAGLSLRPTDHSTASATGQS